MRLTEQQVAALQAGMHPRSSTLPTKPTKYHNTPVDVEGLRFASKKEARHYQELLLMKAGGAIRGFTRQVSLPLASGKRRMVIDFMVVENSGQIRWIDVKGMAPTQAWVTKRDELQHSLGIVIETL